MENSIELTNVSKTYFISDDDSLTIRDKLSNIFRSSSKREIKAINQINLNVFKGEIFGIIGLNGCGKSTLLNLIAGIYEPDKGSKIKLNGRCIRLALGTGFNLEFTARQNIYINGTLLGLSFKQIGQHFKNIVDFAGIGSFIDTKLKYYSSGMLTRLAFSIAVHVDSEIILIDEFFGGVGDMNFRAKSEKIFQEKVLKKHTIVMVNHDIEAIKNNCNRAMLLENGNPLMIGPVSKVVDYYLKHQKHDTKTS